MIMEFCSMKFLLAFQERDFAICFTLCITVKQIMKVQMKGNRSQGAPLLSPPLCLVPMSYWPWGRLTDGACHHNSQGSSHQVVSPVILTRSHFLWVFSSIFLFHINVDGVLRRGNVHRTLDEVNFLYKYHFISWGESHPIFMPKIWIGFVVFFPLPIGGSCSKSD